MNFYKATEEIGPSGLSVRRSSIFYTISKNFPCRGYRFYFVWSSNIQDQFLARKTVWMRTKMANPDACLLKSREAHNGRWNTCAGDVRTDSLLSVLGVRHSFGRTSVYTKKRLTTNVTPATIYSSTWRKCVYMHDNVDRTMIYLACIMHPSMIYRTLRHSTDKFSQRHATLARQKTDQLLLLQLVLIHAYQTLQSFHLIFKTTSNLR